MRIMFINPPFTDFTQPGLSIPTLVGYLNQFNKFSIFQSDMNIEFFNELFSRKTISKMLDLLDQKNSVIEVLPKKIEDAKLILKSKQKFYEMSSYVEAMVTLKIAIKIMNELWQEFFINDSFNIEFTNEYNISDRNYYKFLLEDFIKQENNIIKEIVDNLIKQYIVKYKPDVICISNIYDSQNFMCRYILSVLNDNYPSIITIIGGTAITEQVKLIKYPSNELYDVYFYNPNFICQGYGEYALYDLLNCIMDGNGECLDNIRNIVYIDSNNRYCNNGIDNSLNLNECATPEFNKEELKLYLAPEIVIPIAPTRGCYWGRCSFCNFGFSDDNKSTALYIEANEKKVIDDLRILNREYNADNFMFFCDVIHPKYADNMADLITKSDLEIYWGADFRLEKFLLCKDRIRLYRESGLIYIAFGMESCSQRVLNLMKKGTRAKDFKEIIRSVSDEDICVDLMVFSDFPKESPEDYLETLKFLYANKDYYHTPIGIGKFTLLKDSFVAENEKLFNISIEDDSRCEIMKSSLSYEDHNVYVTNQEKLEEIDRYEEFIYSSSFMNERPWACGNGTAHTFLYIKKHGKEVLKDFCKFYEGAMNIAINLYS